MSEIPQAAQIPPQDALYNQLPTANTRESHESVIEQMSPLEVGVLGGLATEHEANQDAAVNTDVPSVDRLESSSGEYAKPIPTFSEQRADTTRTNEVTYITNAKTALGSHADYDTETRTLTEHDMLNELGSFLERAVANPALDTENRTRAQSVLENLSFIGKKEYDEAIAGIASDWREQLSSNPNLQICAYTGMSDGKKIKSDAYMLDNILKQFSDEELAGWQGRLVTHPENLTADPADSKIIVLDDWSISGEQMRDTVGDLKDYRRNGIAVEAQLIAGTPAALSEDWAGIPIKSYFLARETAPTVETLGGTHLTGSHSSVDHGFDNVIHDIAGKLDEAMPAGTNIVRSYRQGEALMQAARLHEPPVEEPEDDWADFDDDEFIVNVA